MAEKGITREARKAVEDARKMIMALAAADGNEAETRRRVERMFESLMGYDAFKHLSRERAVHGPGEVEYCDFAIQISDTDKPAPVVMVELKRVNQELAAKDLRQVVTYAIDAGCEWVVLTNSREWRLYHVEFSRPPQTTLLAQWDMLKDDAACVAERFEWISYKSLRKGYLSDLWRKISVLSTRALISEMLSEDSVRLVCRRLKRASGVTILPEDITEAFRKLLNEASLAELELVLSDTQRKRNAPKRVKAEPIAPSMPTTDSAQSMDGDVPAKADACVSEGLPPISQTGNASA